MAIYVHDVDGAVKRLAMATRGLLVAARAEVARGASDDALLTILRDGADILETAMHFRGEVTRDRYADTAISADDADLAEALDRAHHVLAMADSYPF